MATFALICLALPVALPVANEAVQDVVPLAGDIFGATLRLVGL